MDVLSIAIMLISFLVGSLSFIALVILIVMHVKNKAHKNYKPVKQSTSPGLKKIPKAISASPIITH